MTKTKLYIIGAIILAAIGAYFAFVHKSNSAAAGLPAKYGTSVIDANLYVTGQFVSGGLDSITAATTTGQTLTLGDLQNSVVSINPSAGSVTYTFPAATTSLSTFLPNIGDNTYIYFWNATTTGSATVTLAGGSGTTLLSASSTAVIQPNKFGIADIFRDTASTLRIGFTVSN